MSDKNSENRKDDESRFPMIGGAAVHKMITEIEARMAAGEEFSAKAGNEAERETLRKVRGQNAASGEGKGGSTDDGSGES